MYAIALSLMLAVIGASGGVPALQDEVQPVILDNRLKEHLDAFNERVLAQGSLPSTEEESFELGRSWVDELETDYGRDSAVSMLTQVILIDSDEEFVRTLRPGLILANLYEDVLAPSPFEIVRAVAPHYPADRSGAREPYIHMLLHMAVEDRNEYRWSTDFEPVKSVLQDAWDDGVHTYDGLVDFMFDWHAILAMMAMHELEGMDAEDVESLFQQVRVVASPYKGRFRIIDDVSSVDSQRLDEAEMILRKLSKDDSLWARVFVAEVLSTVPELRDPEIEGTLREDPHWLIQRRMAYLDEEVDAAEE